MTPEEARNELKAKLLTDLVSSVKQAASTGEWVCKVPAGIESQNAGEVAKAAMKYAMEAMTSGLPMWFMQSLNATKTILRMDEMQGLECLAALYLATDRASDELRLLAVDNIIQVVVPSAVGFGVLPGMFGG